MDDVTFLDVSQQQKQNFLPLMEKLFLCVLRMKDTQEHTHVLTSLCTEPALIEHKMSEMFSVQNERFLLSMTRSVRRSRSRRSSIVHVQLSGPNMSELHYLICFHRIKPQWKSTSLWLTSCLTRLESVFWSNSAVNHMFVLKHFVRNCIKHTSFFFLICWRFLGNGARNHPVKLIEFLLIRQ